MASKSTAPTQEFDLGEEIDDLTNLLERTKVLYEQYFMGIQKRAPEVLHRQVERRMRKIMQLKIRNTGQRFRFQTLSQKYGSYNTYWRRTMRAIEQGRYTRHLAKASRRAAAEGKEMPAEMLTSLPKRLREKLERDRKKIAARHGVEGAEAEPAPAAADDASDAERVRQPAKKVFEVDEMELNDLDIDAMFSAIKTGDSSKQRAAPSSPPQRPAPPAAQPRSPAPAPKAPPRPVRQAAKPATGPGSIRRAPTARPVGAPSGMTERQTRELYDRFVQAKKLVGADTSKLSYDRMLKTLNKQAPKIMQQHKAKGVKFDVVIKDNGVVLKAKPVKG